MTGSLLVYKSLISMPGHPIVAGAPHQSLATCQFHTAQDPVANKVASKPLVSKVEECNELTQMALGLALCSGSLP